MSRGELGQGRDVGQWCAAYPRLGVGQHPGVGVDPTARWSSASSRTRTVRASPGAAQIRSTRSRTAMATAMRSGYGHGGTPDRVVLPVDPRLLGWARRRGIPSVAGMITLHIEHPISDLAT